MKTEKKEVHLTSAGIKGEKFLDQVQMMLALGLFPGVCQALRAGISVKVIGDMPGIDRLLDLLPLSGLLNLKWEEATQGLLGIRSLVDWSGGTARGTAGGKHQYENTRASELQDRCLCQGLAA